MLTLRVAPSVLTTPSPVTPTVAVVVVVSVAAVVASVTAVDVAVVAAVVASVTVAVAAAVVASVTVVVAAVAAVVASRARRLPSKPIRTSLVRIEGSVRSR